MNDTIVHYSSSAPWMFTIWSIRIFDVQNLDGSKENYWKWCDKK
jgi:hypothetical protein